MDTDDSDVESFDELVEISDEALGDLTETGFEHPVVESTPPSDLACVYCGRDNFKTLQGLQVHQGRVHKQSFRQDKAKVQGAQPSTPKAKKTTADIIDGALRTSKAAGKLSVQSQTLLAKLLGVLLVLIVVRGINASRNPPMNESEAARLELDQAQLEVMFKPLFDLLGSSKVVANGVNSIAKQRDYVLCGVYWYQYYNTVRELLNEKEIKAPKPKAPKVETHVTDEQAPHEPVVGFIPPSYNDQFQA